MQQYAEGLLGHIARLLLQMNTFIHQNSRLADKDNIYNQRRSQECELGGLPSLAPSFSSTFPLPSPPLLTGVRGV